MISSKMLIEMGFIQDDECPSIYKINKSGSMVSLTLYLTSAGECYVDNTDIKLINESEILIICNLCGIKLY